MRGTTSVCTLALFSLIATAPGALAQNSDHSWSKTYALSGRPTLAIETGDAHLEIRSCGDCHSIRISAETTGEPLSRYRIEESQSGDQVTFRFKEKMHVGISFHVDWHSRANVSIDVPSELALDAKTEDGNVEISGLRGDLKLRAGDGKLDLRDLGGSLRMKSGDGHVRIADFNGSLDANISDGNITADGVFTGVSVHSSDGSIDLTARPHSKTAQPWDIKSNDGGVTVRLPKEFPADLDVHTSDGTIHSALPLTLDHYDSGGSSRNELRGRLNGGGGAIIIRTSDGSVRLATD